MKLASGIIFLGFVLAAAANFVSEDGSLNERDVNAAADNEEAEYGRPNQGGWGRGGGGWGRGGGGWDRGGGGWGHGGRGGGW
ncbi:unnamed protein product [Penicillium bialowiezense]